MVHMATANEQCCLVLKHLIGSLLTWARLQAFICCWPQHCISVIFLFSFKAENRLCFPFESLLDIFLIVPKWFSIPNWLRIPKPRRFNPNIKLNILGHLGKPCVDLWWKSSCLLIRSCRCVLRSVSSELEFLCIIHIVDHDIFKLHDDLYKASRDSV